MFRERILNLRYGHGMPQAGWHTLLMPGQTLQDAGKTTNKCYIIQMFDGQPYCQKWVPGRARYIQLPRAFARLAYLAVFPNV